MIRTPNARLALLAAPWVLLSCADTAMADAGSADPEIDVRRCPDPVRVEVGQSSADRTLRRLYWVVCADDDGSPARPAIGDTRHAAGAASATLRMRDGRLHGTIRIEDGTAIRTATVDALPVGAADHQPADAPSIRVSVRPEARIHLRAHGVAVPPRQWVAEIAAATGARFDGVAALDDAPITLKFGRIDLFSLVAILASSSDLLVRRAGGSHFGFSSREDAASFKAQSARLDDAMAAGDRAAAEAALGELLALLRRPAPGGLVFDADRVWAMAISHALTAGDDERAMALRRERLEFARRARGGDVGMHYATARIELEAAGGGETSIAARIAAAEAALAAAVDDVGANDPALAALYDELARMQGEAGLDSQRLRSLLRAIELLDMADDRPPYRLAELLIRLGDAYLVQSEFAAARTAYERALPIAREDHGPEGVVVAQVQEALGNALFALDDIAAARRHFDAALAVRRGRGELHRFTRMQLAAAKALGPYAVRATVPDAQRSAWIASLAAGRPDVIALSTAQSHLERRARSQFAANPGDRRWRESCEAVAALAVAGMTGAASAASADSVDFVRRRAAARCEAAARAQQTD